MKGIILRLFECFVLFFAVGYLSTFALSFFIKLTHTLPVEFITYKPTHMLKGLEATTWASLFVAVVATALEWKKERRMISYLIFVNYFAAPFVSAIFLFFITSSIVDSYDPQELEFMGNQLSTEIIPMHLFFIGFILFPPAHFLFNKIKGENQPAQVNPCNPPDNLRTT